MYSVTVDKYIVYSWLIGLYNMSKYILNILQNFEIHFVIIYSFGSLQTLVTHIACCQCMI